ncbi:CRISPR-associated protein Cas4 [Rhodocaloribacter sp.]
MAWAEEDLVPISALQHYVYCPRQCALIHVEQVWDENVFTLRGRRAHEQVDAPGHRRRGEERTVRALPLWSDRLGLVGRADVVVFGEDGAPYPVEHKVGPRKARRADEVQLCAQALCLEEMFARPVPEGALFYGRSRRRRTVVFDEALRTETEATVAAVRALFRQTVLPPPAADARCRYCSLLEACMPFAPKRMRSMEEP